VVDYAASGMSWNRLTHCCATDSHGMMLCHQCYSLCDGLKLGATNFFSKEISSRKFCVSGLHN